MLATIVGGLIGFSGAVAIQYLKARSDRQERSHQERRDAYGALARATWDLSTATSLYLGTGGEAPEREAFVRALHELPRQAVLLELVGSPAVIAASDELTSFAMGRLMELAKDPTMEDIQVHAEELGRRLGALLDAARGDLRPPATTR